MPNTLGLHRLHCLHCLHRVHRVRLLTCWALFAALPLGACGGGGGTPPTYSIGGTVSGIDAGQPAILRDNGGDDLTVSANGAFAFVTRIASGGAYAVTVTAPEGKTCTVTGGSGTVGTASISTVAVACSTVANYTVGGTVSGLVGSGLALAICKFHGVPGGHGGSYVCDSSLQVSASGAFTLGGAYPAMYSGDDRVEVTQQPSSPTQQCVVGNAAISTQNGNDTSVTVSCAEYSYVTNVADNTISAYTIDATTGALAVVGTPIATGASPHAIVGTSEKSLVFVANEASNDVSAFTVNPTTGALTAVPGSPFAAGTNPEAMTVIESLNSPEYLIVANAGSDNFLIYDIDPTGALAHRSVPATPYATGKGPTSIAIRPGGGLFIYVANHGGSNDISAFNDGLNPVPGSPFPAGGNPLSLAFGAGGMFLYTANPDATNPSISGFSIDPATGALAPLSGSPFPLPVSHYIATDQTGAYLYVTSGANVVGYAIDATTGALTPLPGFPVSAGANAYSITVDPTNQFLYVANDGAANIAAFTLDASTGALTPMAGSPFPAGHHPAFIAVF
jgi:6-phosphogluconolactonase (cycloisomerase 2 family)